MDTGQKLTATDFSHVSNANHYFCELERMGLITSEWGDLGDARVKFRWIPEEKREAAARHLSGQSEKGKHHRPMKNNGVTLNNEYCTENSAVLQG